jgi:hypothetical protein
MCFSRLLFFICFILIHPLTPTVAQHVCSSGGNYTSNSTYGENLKSVLATMSSNTEIDYGFYNFSVGEYPDKVNAIALCRGDISPEECRSCVNATSHELLQIYCPNQKEAIRWPDKCMLRYSNRDIFGVMESQPPFIVYTIQNASDVEGFNQALRTLLDGLSRRASSGNSTRKLAAGSAPASASFQTIYALVQCTPDLEELECYYCLLTTIGLIKAGMVGGRYGTPSCGLWYDISAFFDLKLLEATPPPPSPVPPASPPPVLPPPPTQGIVLMLHA